MQTYSSTTGPEALAHLMHRCCVDPQALTIGIEVERIGMWPDGTTLAYEARSESRPGARKMLTRLGKGKPWTPKLGPAGEPLGYTTPDGNLSLEPGSQLEFSATAVRTLFEMEKQLEKMESEVDDITSPWGLKWIGLGVNPIASIESQDVIPLPRYGMMNDYFATSGSLGRAMMRLTSSLQFNFDYCSEATAVKMLQASIAMTPVSYALFSNSPLYEGKTTGFLSFRSEIWRNTDPARSGILPMVFDHDFGFSKYASHVWKLPLMYAENQQGEPTPAHGRSLSDIAEGKLPGVSVSETNLRLALAQMFTETRWKTGYLEVRSVDGLGPKYRLAAAAFWTGILYDRSASEWVAQELGAKLSASERHNLWLQSCREGLAAKTDKVDLASTTEKLFECARACLVRRGLGEEKFLEPLAPLIEKRICPAHEVLDFWKNEARGDIAMLLNYLSPTR
jgi:glutamate--cysteine ligase